MSISKKNVTTLPVDTGEFCALCGHEIGSRAFCHLWVDGRRVALCSPVCAHTFLRESITSADPEEARVLAALDADQRGPTS